ncbi:MAG: lysine--tRNA ligase [Pseudomonadota bacterium]|nr:lysine--tRNA ligase [Pseudomonadota bacterium]MEC7786909.1 lysine--tRNA ligase [Pseudomonadota bacterium]MEC8107996.1 lysine--tRNA ligase [Pseudomonadota bacterium]MEC8377718.1 lysine--tRNA ligase [Pseudomonadota bacterium]
MSDSQDENHLIEERKMKLESLKDQGINYPNDFRRSNLSKSLVDEFTKFNKEELIGKNIEVSVAGRIMLKRVMGKASFCTIQDMTGRIQLYLRKDALDNYEIFKDSDLGDIVGVKGTLFKTNTGELSVQVSEFNLLTKSLKPLPEKHLGLSDVETKYRKRYLDLLTNPETREVFEIRSKVINEIRQFLINDGFTEVETPMMHSIPGGASAKPFVTHHNALDMDLFLRIAPELYLKRLVVGGMEKVFEINRNFRNEGLSTKHNPEFTMLEFYTAFVDYQYQMDFTENMLREIENLSGINTKIFSKEFERLSMDESIVKHNSLNNEDLKDIDVLKKFCDKNSIKLEGVNTVGNIKNIIFETTVEENLIKPTFIYNYPIEISPLARSLDKDGSIAERFELFVNGKELGNSFSELNDPKEQAKRFDLQVEEKNAGDEEAMHFDKDYIEALEYGLAPCAGVGIGIDRLIMLLSGRESIRDVVLFPQLKNK